MRFSDYYGTSRQLTSLLISVVLILTSSMMPFTDTVQAFLPERGITAGLYAGITGSWTHGDITREAIHQLFRLPKYPHKSIRNAIEEISLHNDYTDYREYHHAAAHFDGDSFYLSQERLKKFKRETISALRRGNVRGARVWLGRALHTLQDFYSHSTWIEMGNTRYWDELGELDSNGVDPDKSARPCRIGCIRDFCYQCVGNKNPWQQFLTTGYFKGDDRRKPHIYKCNHGGPGDGYARGLLGAGINKDTYDCGLSPRHDLHITAKNIAREATKDYIADIWSRVGNQLAGQLIGDLNAFGDLAFVIDTSGSMYEEIERVRQQILQIVDYRLSHSLPTRYILMPFNDPGIGPLTVTYDAQVFRAALNNLSAGGGGDCPELPYAALYRALEEMDNGGTLMMFTDAGAKDSQLSGAVSASARAKNIGVTSVYTGGEADCPAGLSYARLASTTGGLAFTLPDIESGAVTSLADFLVRKNSVDLLNVSGRVSGTDQTYTFPIDSLMTHAIFAVSGVGTANVLVRRPDGQFVQPNDPGVNHVPLSSGIIYSISSPVAGTWSLTLTGSQLPESPTVQQNLTTSAQSTEDNHKNSAGALANETRGNSKGQSGTISSAEASASAFSQSEEFSIKVSGESTLDIPSFHFAELKGRPAHEGLFPLQGLPLSNQPINVIAQLTPNDATTVQFELRSPDGAVLQTVPLTEDPWPGAKEPVVEPTETQATPPRIFSGELILPDGPFQVYVTGLDVNGMPYQRTISGNTKPQTVQIITPDEEVLYPGKMKTYKVRVKNLGQADTFKISGVDTQNFLSAISPNVFTLATNETKEVTVRLQVPGNALPGTFDTITLTVQSTGTTEANNQAIMGPISVEAIAALQLGQVTATPIGGNGDTMIDPGEGASISVRLNNSSSVGATDIQATLSTANRGIKISQGTSNYPDLAPSSSGVNDTPFAFYLPGEAQCGQVIDFTLSVTMAGSDTGGIYNFSVQTGQSSVTTALTTSYTGSPVPIPDNDPNGVNIPLTVGGFSGNINDINFRFDGSSCTTVAGATTVGLDHTYVSDLVVSLTSPRGTTITLINGVGDDGNNFCNTVLDDEGGASSIQSATRADAPFARTYRPAESLGTFKGENPNGTWTLHVSDNVGFDIGRVRAFSLVISSVQYSCNIASPDTTPPICAVSAYNPGPPSSGDITAHDTGIGLAAVNIIGADNVEGNVPAFTPGATAPMAVTGTLTDQGSDGSFEIEAIDVAGNVSSCGRTVTTSTPRKILFRSRRDAGNAEVYVMNPDGSNQTNLSNTPMADEYRAVWSPDGTKIAFAVDYEGSHEWDIYVMNADGSNRVNLIQNSAYEFDFAWSSDGTKIVFESDRNWDPALYVMNADGTGVTQLAYTEGSDQPPSWSPNGAKIAYTSYVDGNGEIYVMNPDGANQTNLTNNSALDITPVWSPDSTRILFRSRQGGTDDLYAMNSDGSGVQRLTNDSAIEYTYAWSPDGTRIAFETSRDGNSEIYVMNANGSGQINVTNHSGSDYSPSWSPDGTHILFTSYRGGNAEIYAMAADGSGPRNLTGNPASDTSGQWQPGSGGGSLNSFSLLSPMYDFTKSLSIMDVGPKATTGATDTGGRVVRALIRAAGEPERKTFIGMTEGERLVKVRNGSPGLRKVEILVNGTIFRLTGLSDKEVRIVDVASALVPGRGNTVTVTTYGQPGSKASVVITD